MAVFCVMSSGARVCAAVIGGWTHTAVPLVTSYDGADDTELISHENKNIFSGQSVL